jgi:hypothetical protein
MSTPINEKSNYLLLADVMRQALRFYKLNRNGWVVLDVILDHSFRVGLPSARFQTQEPLLILCAMTMNRMSETLNDLVTSRICIREGIAKGPFRLKPNPDWYDWQLPAACPKYLDKQYVASLVGYVAVMTDGIWVAEPVPKVDPVVAAAQAYARGEGGRAVFPGEKNVTHEDVAGGSASSTRPRGRPPRVLSPEEVAAENEARAAAARATSEENQGYAARLFPEWDAHRREPYIEALIADWGNAVVFQALQHAQESRKPIKRPWGFLKMLCRELGKPKPPPSA